MIISVGSAPHNATFVRVLPWDSPRYSLPRFRWRSLQKMTYLRKQRVKLWLGTPRIPLLKVWTRVWSLPVLMKMHIASPLPLWMALRHPPRLWKMAASLLMTCRWIHNTTVLLYAVNLKQNLARVSARPLVPLRSPLTSFVLLLSRIFLALVLRHPLLRIVFFPRFPTTLLAKLIFLRPVPMTLRRNHQTPRRYSLDL